MRGCLFSSSTAVPVSEEKEGEKKVVEEKVTHPATCDSCQQGIVGIRYKCKSLPFPSVNSR